MRTTESGIFVGIDVSQARLDIAVRPVEPPWSVRNDESGIGEVVDRLRSVRPTLIVLEATGGLEVPVVGALAAAELPVVVMNPRQVRDFAKATGELAKTDAIDAGILARFGEAVRPEIRPFKDPQTRALAALLARRRQLVEMLTAEKNRLHRAPQQVGKDIQAHIRWLDKRLETLNLALHEALKQSPVWRIQDKIVRSVPGVGPILSLTLMADLPELGTLNRWEVAALAGVAPFNRDSGRFRGRRAVWGGRAEIRAVLYMSTLAAVRCNPAIGTFYRRLTGGGKKHKVALTACMRKLLVMLNTMVKNQTHWNPDYTSTT